MQDKRITPEVKGQARQTSAADAGRGGGFPPSALALGKVWLPWRPSCERPWFHFLAGLGGRWNKQQRDVNDSSSLSSADNHYSCCYSETRLEHTAGESLDLPGYLHTLVSHKKPLF